MVWSSGVVGDGGYRQISRGTWETPTGESQLNSGWESITIRCPAGKSARLIVVQTPGNAGRAKGPCEGHVSNKDVLIFESRLTMSTTEDGPTENAAADQDPCGRHELPVKLSRLRRKLNQKAKQEPKFRFYAVYDRIYRIDVLQAAYAQVRQNKGAPGVDGVSFADIESAPGGVFQFLEDLQAELRSKRYQPQAVRRVFIPKPDGRLRPLGIPTIRDRRHGRMVQNADT